MLKIGLTGGIGSGKTTIANTLRQLGYKVYIADREAARLIRTHPQIREELTEAFGPSVYLPSGELNKQTLAACIFTNPEKLALVNRIVHPRVHEDFNRWCRQQQADLVFFESAILFESGFRQETDYTICIYASPATRIKRVIARDRTTADQIRERMKNQMSDEEKCAQSDFTICTDDGNMILDTLFSILEQLKNKF